MRAEIEIWKAGRKIADAPEIQSHTIDEPTKAKLYYLPRIKMVPPVLFEHLAGRALMAFLDESALTVRFAGEEPQQYDGLRYMHGRSEAMKGSPSISAVLLAQLEAPIGLPELVALQPRIYEKFLQICGPGSR